MSKKKSRHKQKESGRYGCVEMPITGAIAGGIGLLFFLPLLIISIVTKAGAGLTAIAAVFCFACVPLMLTVNQRIDYTAEGFVYRDMLRISHRYGYDKIKRIRISRDIYIFAGRRVILIDAMAEGGSKFARFAARYAKGAKITGDGKGGLFGGNAANPEEFIAVYIIIGLLPLGLMLWAVFGFRDISPEGLTAASAKVSGYYFDEHDGDSSRIKIAFEGIDEELYSWYFTEDTADFADFEKDAGEGRAFDILYGGDGGRFLYELRSDTRVYFTLDEYNENMRENRHAGVIISAGMLGIWLLYVIVSSYIMSNGEKYPRLLRLFVKEDYIIKK
ncbi:MAG: hypothetical protein NC078_05305 [Ruminococcus sp.]|nr:hypothetical protein [Ruminococcus sp.]